MSIFKQATKGAGAIAAVVEVPISQIYKIEHVTLHLSAAPTTSEDFTITLDANAGAAYDTLLQTTDLSSSSTTDLVWYPDASLHLTGGDALDIEYLNTDGALYGLEVVWSC
jgi:hypothetical protein